MHFTKFIVSMYDSTSWRQEIEAFFTHEEYTEAKQARNKESELEKIVAKYDKREGVESRSSSSNPKLRQALKELLFFSEKDSKLKDACFKFDKMDKVKVQKWLKDSTNKHAEKYWASVKDKIDK